MEIELKVDCHPSGNCTLKQRYMGESMWEDLKDPKGLLANDNKLDFYRKVANHISKLSVNGYKVIYTDTQSE